MSDIKEDKDIHDDTKDIIENVESQESEENEELKALKALKGLKVFKENQDKPEHQENKGKKVKNVVIVMCKYSVVVKGIERKLKELGCKVSLVTQEKEDIPKIDEERESQLFILYLPTKIMDDMLKFNWLEHIYNVIYEMKGEIIVIGDKWDRDDLAGRIFDMLHVAWLDRPLKMEELELAVTEGIIPGSRDKRKKHILIVDDDPSYAKIVREWLKDIYQVNIVTAGIQAITFLAKNRVDLILLDYEMPVVDGPQVFQMLRQEPSTQGIPVVFLTGVGAKEQVERVLQLKPKGYVLKSTTKEKLLSYLQSKL